MSNKVLSLLSGFPRAPLQNGINRYIPQLKRITLKFCKSHGTSGGMRDFIENDLVDFAKCNPGTVVYVKPRRHRLPYIYAEYLNGETENIACNQFSREEIRKWINLLTTKSKANTIRYRKFWHTDNPSIQGVWSPFTNRDPALNLATFPMTEYHDVKHLPSTATEKLLTIYEKQKLNSSVDQVDENKLSGENKN